MSFNFSELQQKADRTIHNADEFVRKWIDFISAPAGNVTLEYYDQNGNLQSVSFSNRNKLVQDFISNVNSAMSKTFYVDVVHGNDGNDGSSAKPFKTFKKAVSSVPVGGLATIILKSDVAVYSSDPVTLDRKSIIVTTDGTVRAINFVIDNTGVCMTLNTLALLRIRANIVVSNTYDTIRRTAIAMNDHGSSLQVEKLTEANTNFQITIGDNSRLATATNIMFTDNAVGNIDIGANSSLANYYRGGIFRFPAANITINNSSTYTITDYLENIIRDVNGVPRNILSNLVL